MQPPIQKVPPHLDNGIPSHKRDVFHYDGVPMSFYHGRQDIVVKNATRLAPFFRIVDGKITQLDWQFYIKASEEYREALMIVLWAAGVLTTKKLNTFSIRPSDEEEAHFGPTVYNRNLFFAEDRLEDAEIFANEVVPQIAKMEHAEFKEVAGAMARGVKAQKLPDLSIFQCTALAQFVEIRSPVTA